MKKLNVSDDLPLPAAETVTQTIVVYGGKGMGKTNFGSVLVEELAKHRMRFSVIDPMGVWYGLQNDASGNGPGVEVLILGGKHGDIPIEPTGGAVVADLVADEDVDVIIDISRRPNGTMWSLGERIRFVSDYCSRLYERQGERKRPMMQVIDEAGRFCPQMIPHGSPDIARCVGVVERMVEEGRNVGIGVCLLTQRSARMNKSVSELAECMVAFRTTGPNSVKSIVNWFGEHVEKARWNELVKKLRKLPKGSALVVSPGWLEFEGVAKIRLRWTFDSSKTPTEAGERKMRAKAAKPDLDKYRTRMAETIERVKADDPRELRKQIAELKAENARIKIQRPTPPEKVADTKTVTKTVIKEVPIIRNGHLKRMEAGIERVKSAIELLDKTRDRLAQSQQVVVLELGMAKIILEKSLAASKEKAVQQFSHLVAEIKPLQHYYRGYKKIPTRFDVEAKVLAQETRRVEKEVILGQDGEGPYRLMAGERKILEVLAKRHPTRLTRTQVGTLSGYTASGGTFKNYFGTLRKVGLIRENGREEIEITEEGIRVSDVNIGNIKPETKEGLLEMWLEKLPNRGEREMLKVLSKCPEGISREDLGKETGFTASGGTFKNYIGTLKRNDLAEENHGLVFISDTMTEEILK